MDEHYQDQVLAIAIRQALADAQHEADMERATYLTDNAALAS